MPSLAKHTEPLGQRLAAHLLKRLTFAPTIGKIREAALKSPLEAVNDLFQIQSRSNNEPLDLWGLPWIVSGRTPQILGDKTLQFLQSWWYDEARQDFSIGHKMQFFLHTQFTASINGGREGYYYLALLRQYALGNIKTLALKIVTDNRMLDYLDNETNTATSPNDNFSREFLELFTIGKGPQIADGDYTNYTEHDVEVAAKLLTGFRKSSKRDPDTGLPKGQPIFSAHDTTAKTFSHAFDYKTIQPATNGEEMLEELEEFVEMIFQKPATAKYICTKLYRFFVGVDITPEIEQDIITPLAENLRYHNYELLPVLTQLFVSKHFYDLDDDDPTNQIIGGIIKSPVDLFVGLLSFFEVKMHNPRTRPREHYLVDYITRTWNPLHGGQKFSLFEPPTVAGYPAYHQAPAYHHHWFNTETYLARYSFSSTWLAIHNNSSVNPLDFVTKEGNFSDISNPTTLVREMLSYAFSEIPNENRFNYFLNDVFLIGYSAYYWTGEWEKYLATGNTSIVYGRLHALIRAIIRSQEFQVF
ncbi:MAG: DUF1800 family protein [Saprospiraceae bacterium]